MSMSPKSAVDNSFQKTTSSLSLEMDLSDITGVPEITTWNIPSSDHHNGMSDEGFLRVIAARPSSTYPVVYNSFPALTWRTTRGGV
jgi:hypothetical protein